MFSKVLLNATAAFLCLLGLVLDFLPQETGALLQLPSAPAVAVLIQAIAAAYLAAGYLNWLSRKNLIGGIYSRPLGLANMLLFGVTAIPLDRAVMRGLLPTALPLAVDGLAALFTVFAVAYVYAIFFHDPVPAASQL